MKHKFSGAGVALVTPFNTDYSVDYKSLERLIEHTINGGVDYVVVLGTTGESATLSESERAEIVRFCVSCVAGRTPIVYGHGGNNTRALIEAFDRLNLDGVDALLSVSPYYNKPSQEGIFSHFAALAETSPLPLIVYNVPGRTGSNMSADTTLRLAHAYPNIIGVKEASGNLSQAAHIIKDKPDHFAVISGDDNLTIQMISQGGSGTISVSANAFPRTFSRMTHSALDGDFKTAREEFYKLLEVTELLFADGNPAGIKSALTHKGIIKNTLRQPLCPASEQPCTRLSQLIDRYGI